MSAGIGCFQRLLLETIGLPLLAMLLLTLETSVLGTSQCPWSSSVPELESSCICDYNLGRELSVQCDVVDYGQLLEAVRTHSSPNVPIDLLYVNNSTIGSIEKASPLSGIAIHNLQLSSCKISHIEKDAFKGQEASLRSLNLKDNQLSELPSDALKSLKSLAILDLSINKIIEVKNDTFVGLKLVTLKLSDNEVTLAPWAFRGLESTLKNLNLKGTRQKRVPEALRGLSKLAFLDLSQNSIRELPGPNAGDGHKGFEGLSSLTGLNLERNLIQVIGPDAFHGVTHTLSSLSLLNNLISDFPTNAIHSIRDLKVLDIGFNLISDLPTNAFENNTSITLLAIDGNPLSTVSEQVFQRLNGTLRGLSLGGRFLVCDCKLRWIVDWIRNFELQVTSRERKPQFCGSPPRFQSRNFYNINAEELSCEKAPDVIGIGTVESVDTKLIMGPVSGVVDHLLPTTQSSSASSTTAASVAVNTASVITSSTALSSSSSSSTSTVANKKKFVPPQQHQHASISSMHNTPSTTIMTTTSSRPTPRTGNVFVTRTTPTSPPASKFNQDLENAHRPKPPLVIAPPIYKVKSSDREIIVKEAFRQDNSVVINWDTESSNNNLGYRVIYRLFGDSSFKQGPPLESNENEFRIKNVPSQECIIVCVVTLDETNLTPANVPYNQCREVRTENSTSNMDKITIAASAAICATILAALIIFIVANRRKARKLHTLHNMEQTKMGGPISGLPVNCCSTVGQTPSPGGPISSMATLSAYNTQKEWDQVSAYSSRSIPRPRIFPIDRQGSITRVSCIDDMRSQGNQYGTKARSIADGQSQHSYSNSTRYFGNSTLAPSNLISTRPELRQSRQSLTGPSDRMSRAGFQVNHLPPHCSTARRQRPRSRNRNMDQPPTNLPRPGSRYSLADSSSHTYNNYEDNNWTDHDMDIYMARNPTTRGNAGLVPL